MRGHHLFLATTLLACGGGRQAHLAGAHQALAVHAPASGAPIEEDGANVPYDRAVMKSIHNAYERDEPLLDQLVYHRVRSLELDVHVRREGVIAPKGDWFVYHEDNPLMRGSSCSQLADCLDQLAAFHAAVPRHEVVTLFVDLKDEPSPGHGAEDLDRAMVDALGREAIVTPADLVAACPGAESVRDAVAGACRFPTLRELRGKFVLAVTEGTACDRASNVARYGGGSPRSRLAFMAPSVDASCTMDDYDARPDVVFFNMEFAERARAAEVRRRGLVARVYAGGIAGGLDDAPSFAAARRLGANHLVTDRVNLGEDAWAATHRARGFPFTCEGCDDALVEPGAMLGVRATSGDQEGSRDSGYYALEEDAGDATYRALVSVPSSHVEPFAKSCLVARASTDPEAANVAVCRTFDVHGPRMQIRSATGGSTRTIEAPAFDGLVAEAPAFLRLAVERAGGGGSSVVASASRDGRRWRTIGRTTLPVALPYRGVAVSSHGSAPVKALFANLVRERGGTAEHVTAAALEGRAIGALAKGDAFDGVFPGVKYTPTPAHRLASTPAS